MKTLKTIAVYSRYKLRTKRSFELEDHSTYNFLKRNVMNCFQKLFFSFCTLHFILWLLRPEINNISAHKKLFPWLQAFNLQIQRESDGKFLRSWSKNREKKKIHKRILVPLAPTKPQTIYSQTRKSEKNSEENIQN